MTAALGCFDTERHGQSLFPSLFTSGTGIPLSPLFPCNPPPTDSYNPPTHALLPPLPPPVRICPLRAAPQGPLHPLHSRRFPLAQACCFHFIWDAKSSFTGIRGGWEGKQVWAECDRRVEEGGGSYSAPGQLRKPSMAAQNKMYKCAQK